MQPGRRNSITDVTGFLVGNSTDNHIKSGVTVFLGEKPFVAAVHVMGGAPGTRETDLLAPDRLVKKVDCLVLSGGSAFGLDAASGIGDSLSQKGRGFPVGDVRVPIIPSAILFDLLNGGQKNWTENPYGNLGQEALSNADKDFQIGSFGAGTGASTNNLKGGLGTASIKLESGYTVGALMAVNSLGTTTQYDEKSFWAAFWEFGDEFGGLGTTNVIKPDWTPTFPGDTSEDFGNTTIGIVATDAKLDQAQLTRIAVAAHDGIARAVVPSHTIYDGDLIFAASSGIREVADPDNVVFELSDAAARTVSRAIARGVYHASPAENDTLPTWNDKFQG
ncbi:MAG: P1 family peptidase [Rhodobacteraceae bacterium]|nr:P1 family peptidase [Paracoccaceae bacterium]